MFLIAAAVSLCGGTFYAAFVSGEQQWWNDVDDVDSDDAMKKKKKKNDKYKYGAVDDGVKDEHV